MHKTLVSISFCIACLVTHVNAQPGWRASDALLERVVVAVSPDGGQLAIARSSPRTRERHVELWDLNTGALLHTVTGFDGPIFDVFFDPESMNVITTDAHFRQTKIRTKPRDFFAEFVTEFKWWDARTGEFVRKTTLTGPPLETLISPDGSTMAVVRREIQNGAEAIYLGGSPYESFRRASGKVGLIQVFEIKLFNLKTGKREKKMSGRAASLSYRWGLPYVSSAFSPDGRLFAVAAAREVKVWDVMTGKKFQTINKFDGNPIAITFSPDSQTLAISSGEVSEIDWMTIRDSQISVWEVSTAKLTRNLRVKNDFVASLKFAPSGKALLFGTLQYETERKVGTVKVWDLVSDRLATFNVHDDQKVSSLQLMPGKPELVLVSGEDVEIRDTKTWRVKQSFESNPQDHATRVANRFVLTVKQVVAVSFSSDGITVSGVIPEEGLRIWDSRTGGVKPAHELKTAKGLVARSANGMILGEATAHEIKLWDLSTGASRNLPRASSNPVSAFALSYEGSLLAIAEGPQIKLSSSTEHGSPRSLSAHESTVEQLTFSTDDRTVVSADDSGIIKIWDVSTGQLRQSISTGNIVTAVAVDPTGQLLASAGADYVISIWNAATGALQLRLKKHDNVVNALSFSPDGNTLASGGDDRVAVLWDVVAGKSKQTLKGHDLTVTSLAFSPDGQMLATGSGNASLVVWNVNNGKLDRVLR